MNYTVVEDKQTEAIEIRVKGGIDTVSAPELEDHLSEYYNKAKKIILDFTEVSYISSAGLRLLLRADAAMGGNSGFAVKNLNAEVRQVFNLTGFGGVISILD